MHCDVYSCERRLCALPPRGLPPLDSQPAPPLSYRPAIFVHSSWLLRYSLPMGTSLIIIGCFFWGGRGRDGRVVRCWLSKRSWCMKGLEKTTINAGQFSRFPAWFSNQGPLSSKQERQSLHRNSTAFVTL